MLLKAYTLNIEITKKGGNKNGRIKTRINRYRW